MTNRPPISASLVIVAGLKIFLAVVAAAVALGYLPSDNGLVAALLAMYAAISGTNNATGGGNGKS